MNKIKIAALAVVAALCIAPATAMASKFSFSLNLDCMPRVYHCPPPIVYGPPVIERHVFVPAPQPPVYCESITILPYPLF